MAELVDTSIRLLSQEPLAGALTSSDVLRLAAILDRVGYAALEVSGGGAFDAAVRQGVESPWERIRALKARTSTPLALAIRGNFLVGSRPAGDDLVRRFISTAAESGIDRFRIHDPLNDVSNLRVAAEATHSAGREFDAGLLYGTAAHDTLTDAAERLAQTGAARVVLADPSGLLEPHRVSELVAALRERSGLPVGLYCQGATRNGLSLAMEAVRAGADWIACAIYPVALATHRVSAEALVGSLSGAGADPGIDLELIWEASDLVDVHIGDMPIAPIVPRVSVRAARRKLPAGLVSIIDAQLSKFGQRDRLDDVLTEVARVRSEVGEPPLAAPLGQIVASQALVNVLGASRYEVITDELRDLVAGRFGHTPAEVDASLARAVELLGGVGAVEADDLETVRANAQGLASSEEDLLLLALFDKEAEALLQTIRGRGEAGSAESAGPGGDRERLIRSVVAIVQETGVGEITIEEEGVRITARNLPAASQENASPAEGPVAFEAARPSLPESGAIEVRSPMVGTFYRRPRPDSPAFVEEGDAVSAGQVLCILEAMKLMNEVKAESEGIVRRIHVSDGQAVEYGQVLFELEAPGGPPVVF